MVLCMHPIKPTRLALALASVFSIAPAFADNYPVALPEPTQVKGQTHLIADHMDGQVNNELKARGHVVVTRDDQRLEADWLDYFQNKNRMYAGDHFQLTQGGDQIAGTTIDYNMQDRTGTAEKPTFHMSQRTLQNNQSLVGKNSRNEVTTLRGSGQQIAFQGPNKYRLYKSQMNTCEENDDSWYLRSSMVDLNYNTAIGVAHGSSLVFQGVPIFYSPWLDFPLDGRRKSGLLFPSFESGSSGSGVTLGYYWNIAPNYDATFTTAFNTKHGTTFGGEFRYLEPTYSGSINTEQLFKDQQTGENRYAWQANHTQTLGGLTFGYDARYVSDVNYFKDFGDRETIATSTNLKREAWANYGFDWSSGNATTALIAQRYQTLENPIIPSDVPYALLPRVSMDVNQSLPGAFSFNLQTQWTRFTHPTEQNGDRLVLYPSITWNLLDSSWGFFKPKIGTTYTEYNLDAYSGAPSSTLTRSLPIFSADSGLYFEKNTELFGKDHVQTLEPRLYYVYIPYRDQSKIPNFDTSENDFNFAQMFTENRFSGWDKINSASQLTAAVTSRFIDSGNGLERLRFQVGQRYYFKDDEVTLSSSANDQQTKGSSDVLASIGGDLTKAWSLDNQYEYNETLSKTESLTSQVKYNPEAGKVFSVRYRYDRYTETSETSDGTYIYGPLRQVDFGVQWPIARKWYAVGRFNYSLMDNKNLETLGGFEYNDGCWIFRIVLDRYVADATTTKNKIYFELELKGLGGSIGTKTYNTLRLAIPGYSKINNLQQE